MKKRQPLQKKSSGILHSLQINKCKYNSYATRTLIATYVSPTQLIEFHQTRRHSFRCYRLPFGKVNITRAHTHTTLFQMLHVTTWQGKYYNSQTHIQHYFRCYMLPLGKVNDITHTHTYNFWAFWLQNRISNLHLLTPPSTHTLTHSLTLQHTIFLGQFSHILGQEILLWQKYIHHTHHKSLKW
jgi:hypothetical protein